MIRVKIRGVYVGTVYLTRDGAMEYSGPEASRLKHRIMMFRNAGMLPLGDREAYAKLTNVFKGSDEAWEEPEDG
jgi:hypothetical protein